MKIIFLNVFNAQVTEPLRTFLTKHLPDTDIFCFQEYYENARILFAEVDTSTQFAEYKVSKPIDEESVFTNVTLVRKTYKVTTTSSNEKTPGVGLSFFVTVKNGATQIHIANMHGLHKPGKLDTENRLKQSQEILDALVPLEGTKIIGGDLNVLPETKSVQILEEAGYQSLIKEYDIKTTRNHIAWDKHPGDELYYSDYVFVKDVEVTSFEVPPEIVSDHQPMILTIDIEHKTPAGQSV